jgi:PAS domain S-box-containing protein
MTGYAPDAPGRSAGGPAPIEQLLDFYTFLVQANGLVARTDDIDRLYADICDLGIKLDRRLVLAWVGLAEPGSAEVRIVAAAGPATGYLADIHVLAIPEDVRGCGPTGRTLREGRCIIANRFLEDPATAPWHEKARKYGIASSASIPLRQGGVVCGALMLYSNVSDVFNERIAGELEVLSQTLSYALDAAALRQREQRQSKRWQALLHLAQTDEYEGEHGEHEFLGRALEEAQRLTGSRVGFLHLVNEDQQTCELVAWTGAALNDDRLRLEVNYPIRQAGLWVNSFHERNGLIINDYPTAAGAIHSAEDGAVLSRLITVPVIEEDRVRVIAWVGDKTEPYDQDDLKFLQILAADVWRIVRRRRAEDELREALQVVEASPVVCFRWRAAPGWPVDYVSRNISRWGWQAADLLAGRPTFAELVHPEDLPRIVAEVERHTAAGTTEYVQQYRMRTADGRWFWIEDATRVIRNAAGQALAYEGVVSDIDAEKRHAESLSENLEVQRALNRKLQDAQNQLLQSEKMASIGQLAAGVAHEINNPIGFVSSNIGTLARYLGDIFAILDVTDAAAATSTHPEDFAAISAARVERDIDFLRSDTLQLLAESKDGLERVRKIVKDLKDFSRVGETQWQWANIHQALDSTLNIVWNELKYKCTIVKHYGSLPQIYCLVSQLNQVFMNILVNAAQAIETQGEITITTERAGEAAVRILIADNGPGIPPENLNRLFEPFFTTKPVGQGTGLGLSLAWSIVQRHQGRIEVASEPGKGTTFTITLPVAGPSQRQETTA